MNVIVFGAAGKTGSLVVERALAAGHNVSVFMHDDTHNSPPMSASLPETLRI